MGGNSKLKTDRGVGGNSEFRIQNSFRGPCNEILDAAGVPTAAASFKAASYRLRAKGTQKLFEQCAALRSWLVAS